MAVIMLVVASCGDQADAPTDAPRTISSEEVRLWYSGEANLELAIGRRYRVVGRVRRISEADDGSPQITFTGLNAVLAPDIDRTVLERLTPDTYLAVNCQLTNSVTLHPVMDDCKRLTPLTTISADEYRAAYDENVFRADGAFKDKELVVHGKVRLTGKLTSGEDYVSMGTQKGFSDVVAIIPYDSGTLLPGYAKVREATVMFCRGGHRWNQVRSVGLSDCRFLQNY
jgi:hypothetical protein